MPNVNLTTQVRNVAKNANLIEINGEVNASAESVLMDAYNQASANGVKTIILDFSGLDYMNSSGIGLLVTLLIRVQRNKQRLLACGLSDHYRQIFELTRLDEAILIYGDETAALAAINGA